jgi:5-methyltetrahydrofolate--homocysteine methyltransferase
METTINNIFTDVLNGNHKEVVKEVKEAIRQGLAPISIMNDGMIAAMSEVGRRFEAGDYYVPEMLVAARAMQAGMNVLKPFLSITDAYPAGKIAIGTVNGDLHDIGKNLVKMMLEGAGFEVIDLGVNVKPEVFVSAITKHNVDMIAMSALITTTMPAMRPVIQLLEKSGLRQHVRVIIGGAPVTQAYAELIAADGYAPDASRAVSLAKSLLNK